MFILLNNQPPQKEQQNNKNTKLPDLITYYIIIKSIQQVSDIFVFKPLSGKNNVSGEFFCENITLLDMINTMIRFLKHPIHHVHHG